MKLIFVLSVFLSICVTANCNIKVDARINQKELAVYNMLLKDKPKEIVVVSSETVLDKLGIDRDTLQEILKGLRNDTFDNFVKANSVSPKIEDDIRNVFAYRIVHENDFNNDDLKHTRYYVFSRVGFSPDGKQAVVRFSDVCLLLCGKGAYYLLENKNGVWEIVQESVYVQS